VLAPVKIEFDRTEELDEIDRILGGLPDIGKAYERVLEDLGGKTTGAGGLTAEQVVKLGILRKRHEMTHRELSHATSDSMSMRRFLGLELDQVISKSCIHENLKRVTESSWEFVNELIKEYASREKIEEGAAVRGDTTTTETNIHYPTDASLLNDTVRVLCRAMTVAREVLGNEKVVFVNHRRRAKTKLYRINNSRSDEKRHPEYLELMRVTKETLEQAPLVLAAVKASTVSAEDTIRLIGCESALKTYIPLGEKVLSQARRRIIGKEEVPSTEKVVSIFEPHTDIIVKGFRDVVFGHKVSLTTGASGLVLKVSVLDGNPKDSTLVPGMLEEHKDSYTKAPEAMAFDGCFASTANRDLLKEAGTKEITFSKNGSMSLESLVSSPKIHKALMNFRAGIEAGISFLKRVFGFTRVLDNGLEEGLEEGLESFKAALQCGAVACNLTLLARYQINARTD